jgi:hypothetical protein
LENPAKSRLMGAKGRSRVERAYSMQTFVGAYEELFADMQNPR